MKRKIARGVRGTITLNFTSMKGAINRGTAIRGNMGINRLLRLFKTSETSYISLKCGNYCE